MAKFVWGAVCRRIIIDSGSNLVSYIDLIEAIRVPAFPIAIGPLWVGTRFEKTEEGIEGVEARASLIAGDESRPLYTTGGAVSLQANHRRGRIHMLFADVTLPRPGHYRVVIEQKDGNSWTEVARYPLEVDEITPEQREKRKVAKKVAT